MVEEFRVPIVERQSVPPGELFVRRAGQGRPVLLIHGFPLTSLMWQNQLKDGRLPFDLITPDLRGFGQSSPLPSEWTVADFAGDLVDLLTALGIDQVVVCGLSLGGYIAFEILDLIPQSILQLVLCNTRAAADDETTARGRRLMAERVFREDARFVKDAMLPRLVASSNYDKELIPNLDSFFDQVKAESIAVTQLAMSRRRDFVDQLNNIRCQTCVIAGIDDEITPASEMKVMADRIPESSFHVVPQAGHLTPIENPAEFNAVLLKELA